MTLKRSVVSAVVLGAAAFSGSALAGVSGNVGVVSEYMFRGISQGTGAAVQGGIDYSHDSGFYAGLWGSNIDWGVGGAELDGYGGYTKKFNDTFGIDVGAIYYYYPENDEGEIVQTVDPGYDANTIEAYVGLIIGPAAVKYYYTPQYFGAEDSSGDDAAASYLVVSAGFPITDSLNFTLSAGLSDGDGIEATFGEDSYFDYSVGLAKSLDAGLAATFQIVGTDLDDDDPKFLVGAKKTFDL